MDSDSAEARFLRVESRETWAGCSEPPVTPASLCPALWGPLMGICPVLACLRPLDFPLWARLDETHWARALQGRLSLQRKTRGWTPGHLRHCLQGHAANVTKKGVSILLSLLSSVCPWSGVSSSLLEGRPCSSGRGVQVRPCCRLPGFMESPPPRTGKPTDHSENRPQVALPLLRCGLVRAREASPCPLCTTTSDLVCSQDAPSCHRRALVVVLVFSLHTQLLGPSGCHRSCDARPGGRQLYWHGCVSAFCNRVWVWRSHAAGAGCPVPGLPLPSRPGSGRTVGHPAALPWEAAGPLCAAPWGLPVCAVAPCSGVRQSLWGAGGGRAPDGLSGPPSRSFSPLAVPSDTFHRCTFFPDAERVGGPCGEGPSPALSPAHSGMEWHLVQWLCPMPTRKGISLDPSVRGERVGEGNRGGLTLPSSGSSLALSTSREPGPAYLGHVPG